MQRETLMWITGGVSVALVVAAAIIVPRMLLRIPADYVTRQHTGSDRAGSVAGRLALKIGKNVLGIALIVAGIAMLVLPGQGVLTALAGVLLLDFPGKMRLRRWLVSRPWVLRPINWYRTRKGVEPLDRPSTVSASGHDADDERGPSPLTPGSQQSSP